MKKSVILITAISMAAIGGSAYAVNPKADLIKFQNYFKNKFPDTPFADFKNGVYAIDPASREQWEAIEEFPPYEAAVDRGEEAWNTPFANGKSYASCFDTDVTKIRAQYPHYDESADTVVTLEGDLNACRVANGEKPLKWKKGPLADLSAYVAYQGRGSKVNVKVEGEGALKWYARGKMHFYAKRGQLNLSCADCHQWHSGSYVRADHLSPALGHVTHFPVYRSKWGNLGTLHRRYGGCNKQTRFKPFKAQSDEYKALEYFHSYMSNGLEWNGPGARK